MIYGDCNIYWITDKRVETAKILVENGADISIKCYEGKTTSDYAKAIYFARGFYYLLNGISEEIALYPMLSLRNLNRRVIIKPKKDMKYYFVDENLQYGSFEPIEGVLLSITNSFTYPFNFEIGERASAQMFRIGKTDTNGSRTGGLYQVHHDDVDVEFLPEHSHHNIAELPQNLLGHVVKIRSKQGTPVYYKLDGVENVLKEGDTLLGAFWQITLPINTSEKAYFSIKNGEASFYSDEIVIEKSCRCVECRTELRKKMSNKPSVLKEGVMSDSDVCKNDTVPDAKNEYCSGPYYVSEDGSMSDSEIWGDMNFDAEKEFDEYLHREAMKEKLTNELNRKRLLEISDLYQFGEKMSYTNMLEALEKTFNENTQKISQKVVGHTGEKLSIPNLVGPTGVGKTACVKEFAKSKGFDLITIDCWNPQVTNLLVIHLNKAIININSGKCDGYVLLLDNIDRADEQCLDIIEQYRANSLDSFMEVDVNAVDDENPINKTKPKVLSFNMDPPVIQKIKVLYDEIPENLFIVGEQIIH